MRCALRALCEACGFLPFFAIIQVKYINVNIIGTNSNKIPRKYEIVSRNLRKKSEINENR